MNLLYPLIWKSSSCFAPAKVAEVVEGEEVRVMLVVRPAHAVIIRGARNGNQAFPLNEPIHILKKHVSQGRGDTEE